MTGRAALASRVLAILARDGGSTDDELAAELGVSAAELSPVIGLLYRQRRVDRCHRYLVPAPTAAVARPAAARHQEDPMTPPSTSALLEAALACAARGWPVFPLRPATKRPAFPDHDAAHCTRTDPRCQAGHTGWETRATTDPERITRAWTCAAYNIGIATGPAALVVLDLDKAKPGQHPPAGWDQPGITHGSDVLAVLAERHAHRYADLDLFGTFLVRTGRGGLHLYYTAPPGLRLGNTCGAARGGLGWLIDTRGYGGYVVAPGSVIDLPGGGTGTYVVTNDQAPAVLPDWLAGLLTAAQPPSPPLEGRSARLDQVRDLGSYTRTALKGEMERVRAAAPGGRNQALNKAAYQLGRLVAAAALPGDLAAAELYDAASAHFDADPPFTPAEATATITAGLAAGKTRPRPITGEGAAA
ncbi:MAG TPA: bifunctional DNA primase/polymerase [Streptosporangiaceae bacterium]